MRPFLFVLLAFVILNAVAKQRIILHPEDKVFQDSPFNSTVLLCINDSIIAPNILSSLFQTCFNQGVQAIYFQLNFVNASDNETIYITKETQRYPLTSWVFTNQHYFTSFNVFDTRVKMLSFSTLELTACNIEMLTIDTCGNNFSDLAEISAFASSVFNYFIAPNTGPNIPLSKQFSPDQYYQANPYISTSSSSYLCQLKGFYSNAICCYRDTVTDDPFLQNLTLNGFQVLRCDLENSGSLTPEKGVILAFVFSVIIIIVLMFVNVDVFIPILYQIDDKVILSDYDAPIYFTIPKDKETLLSFSRLSLFGIFAFFRVLLSFSIWSLPSIYAFASLLLVEKKELWEFIYIILSIFCFLYGAMFMYYVVCHNVIQQYILYQRPKPVYFIPLAKFIIQNRNSVGYRIPASILSIFFVLSFIVIAIYAILDVFAIIIIGTFAASGVAANSQYVIAQLSLILAQLLALKNEIYFLKKPLLRVKIKLFDENLIPPERITWRQVYAILNRLDWMPSQRVAKRLPLYLVIVGSLLLVYNALILFNGGLLDQSATGRSIFQSVVLLVIGNVGNFFSSDYSEKSAIEDIEIKKAIKEYIDEQKGDLSSEQSPMIMSND